MMPRRFKINSKCDTHIPLKCVDCHQYLSVAPISISPLGYHCGRCITKKEIDDNLLYYHAIAYENLAKTTLFPCQNDSFGCRENINFDEVADHEKMCRFKSVKCPAALCDIKIPLFEVLSHYQKQHKNLIIDGKQFYISDYFKLDGFENKLIILNSKVYLLAICNFFIGDEIWLGLRSIEATGEKFYQLEVKRKNSNALILNQEKIIKYDAETNFEKENMICLELKQIQSVLKGEDLTFSVKLTDSSTTVTSDDSFLEELKCLVCLDYMRSPIYLCKTGHSLCSKCKIQVQQCPLCNARFEGARNFALEKLSQTVEFPSENSLNLGREGQSVPCSTRGFAGCKSTDFLNAHFARRRCRFSRGGRLLDY